ncbi:lysine-rich nucleolar protein 1 [Brachionichthys hirsutus]|uniref:lysine-rich nucleolar protein 1 n=1 Tax=Brachionichthys hirsutus TaxID=412623 RepID=UPI0036043852
MMKTNEEKKVMKKEKNPRSGDELHKSCRGKPAEVKEPKKKKGGDHLLVNRDDDDDDDGSDVNNDKGKRIMEEAELDQGDEETTQDSVKEKKRRKQKKVTNNYLQIKSENVPLEEERQAEEEKLSKRTRKEKKSLLVNRKEGTEGQAKDEERPQSMEGLRDKKKKRRAQNQSAPQIPEGEVKQSKRRREEGGNHMKDSTREEEEAAPKRKKRKRNKSKGEEEEPSSRRCEDEQQEQEMAVKAASRTKGTKKRKVSMEEHTQEFLPVEVKKSETTDELSTNQGFGQWTTAQFGSSEQRQKFLRLMGGFNKRFQPAAGNAGRANMAPGLQAQQLLQRGLQGEFDRAQSRRSDFGNRGTGLGFTAPPTKKFSIDISACRSVRFDD